MAGDGTGGGGRATGRATDGRRTGDDGGEDVGAPQWEDRRVPCARLDLLDRINTSRRAHMAGDGTGGADGRRTGDGRAATTVARTWERRSGRIGGFDRFRRAR
jgi:hypothetical protein